MPTFKYFSDSLGKPVKRSAISSMCISRGRWPGVKGIRFDGYQMRAGRAESGALLPVTRVIEFKSHPSLHEGNAKCVCGKHNGKCECSCGGRNLVPVPSLNCYKRPSRQELRHE